MNAPSRSPLLAAGAIAVAVAILLGLGSWQLYRLQWKRGLIEAVYGRRIRPLNEERLRRLRELEAEAGGAPVPLEGILRAFLERHLQSSHLDQSGS